MKVLLNCLIYIYKHKKQLSLVEYLNLWQQEVEAGGSQVSVQPSYI